MTLERAGQPGSTAPERRSLRLEYVTIPGCRDCVRFEELIARVAPDYPELRVNEVAGDTERGMAVSIGRGVLRFPVILLDDEIVAIESIAEVDLRMTLDGRRGRA